jgi:hypothetical protein
LVVTILAAITQGGGGIQWPGGHVPPPLPWLFTLPAAEQNILLGLAVNELAGLVTDAAARLEIQRIVANLVAESSQTFAKNAASDVRRAVANQSLHGKPGRLGTPTEPNRASRLPKGKK